MENISFYIVDRPFQKRYVLAIYAFFGYFITYAMRTILSVSILEMNHMNTNKSYEDKNKSQNCSEIDLLNQEWSSFLQGHILSSFFYGYIITQIPAGLLTSKYGGKLFFGIGNGICSVFCLLIPVISLTGPYSLIAIRVVQGMAQGLIFSAMHCMWSKWAPPNERSRLSTFGLSGSYIGSMFSLSFGGVIVKLLNWQAVFYMIGSIGVLWTILWFLFTAETPDKHPSISDDEKEFIRSSLPQNDDENSSIPWLSIFKSIPFWAIVAAHFAENWGFFTMLLKLPTFFSDVLNLNIDKIGLISSMPYLFMALFLFISGLISDKMIERRFSVKFVRRLFCCGGFFLQSIFMISISNSTIHFQLTTFMSMAIGLGGMVWASFSVNLLDIGAKYANVLMAISNTIASIPGILSPILTGYLTRNKTKVEWDVVFYISAVIYLLGAFFFLLFSSGKIQPWAFKHDELLENEQTTNRECVDRTAVYNYIISVDA